MRHEPPSWSIAGWLLRLALAPFLGGDHRCGARRCGSMTVGKGDRYCGVHADVMLARFGSGRRAADAARRVSWLGKGTQRRLNRWAMAMAASHGDAFNLVSEGYVPEAYEAPLGIVT